MVRVRPCVCARELVWWPLHPIPLFTRLSTPGLAGLMTKSAVYNYQTQPGFHSIDASLAHPPP